MNDPRTDRPDEAFPRPEQADAQGPAPWEQQHADQHGDRSGTAAGRPVGPAPVEHTQEIPPREHTTELPPAAPVWAQGGNAQHGGSTQYGGQTPIGPSTRTGRRRGWVLPVVVAGAVAVAGGGIIASQLSHDGDTGQVAASSSSSPTSQIGENTAPAVEQGSAVAPDWTKTAGAVTPSVVSIDVQSGQQGGEGSGVIIDKLGHVVTNNHVASGAGTDAQITVTLSDQRAYGAKVVGTDPSTDLAVLKLDGAPGDLRPVSFGDSSKLAVGQPVMAVGNPLGLSGTVTTGIVSALNRPVTTQSVEQQDPYGQGASGNEVFTNAIQTSAAINPGNSGGALVDAQGRLIGINSSIASLGSSDSGSQSGNIGIGFAIPVNEVSTIAKQLIATGKAEHAYLGVAAPTGIVQDGSSRREAAVVQRVYPNTPAASAGLQQGDAIISLDGTAITGYTSLISQVYAKSVGDKSTIEYVRDGKRASVEVTFTKRPAS